MSAVSTYDQLYAGTLSRLKAAPGAAVLLSACQWTAKDFFTATKAWCKKLDAIDLKADEQHYELSLGESPTKAIDKVDAVWLRTQQEVTDGEDGTLQDLSEIEFDIATSILTLPVAPASAVTDGLVVRCVFVPHYNATSADADMMARYYDAIVAGAAAFLSEQDGLPWASPAIARKQGILYQQAKDRAAADRLRKYRNVQIINGGSPCSFFGS